MSKLLTGGLMTIKLKYTLLYIYILHPVLVDCYAVSVSQMIQCLLALSSSNSVSFTSHNFYHYAK